MILLSITFKSKKIRNSLKPLKISYDLYRQKYACSEHQQSVITNFLIRLQTPYTYIQNTWKVIELKQFSLRYMKTYVQRKKSMEWKRKAVLKIRTFGKTSEGMLVDSISNANHESYGGKNERKASPMIYQTEKYLRYLNKWAWATFIHFPCQRPKSVSQIGILWINQNQLNYIHRQSKQDVALIWVNCRIIYANVNI